MITKFTKTRYALPIGAGLLLLVLAATASWYFLSGNTPKTPPPLLELNGNSVDVSAYQYLGTWVPPDDSKLTKRGNKPIHYPWKDAAHLSFEKGREVLQVAPGASKLAGSIRQLLTSGSESGAFEGMRWQENQVSLFAFRALTPWSRVALLEIDTDDAIAVYINGKLTREMSGADTVELGTNLLIPVALQKGENLVLVKALSNDGPPRLRMSLILDQSKDFQAAWDNSWGFLTKKIYNWTGNSFEPPTVSWDSLLNRLTISAEISDVLTGKVVASKEAVRSGNIVREGGKSPKEGIYKISYKSNSPQPETADEYFIMGSPINVYNAILELLGELSWDSNEQLNIGAQHWLAGILFSPANYKVEDQEWRERIVYTLASLANFVRLKNEQKGNIFKDMTGLQYRGFISKIDNSEQFYRLYIPSNHARQEKPPLLVIMPTTLQKTNRSFLESRFAAAHREALQVCRYAEKHGYAVLWPGFRNTPDGWTYESTHAAEALADVEGSHPIDGSKISLYGICSGGIFAGRLASIYPNRFSAIVYDRAMFDWRERFLDPDDPMSGWFRTINPSEKIIENRNIKILVLNDGTRITGHGEIGLTNEFLETALEKRPDITYALGQRKIGLTLWAL